jgi:hypothetical protein
VRAETDLFFRFLAAPAPSPALNAASREERASWVRLERRAASGGEGRAVESVVESTMAGCGTLEAVRARAVKKPEGEMRSGKWREESSILAQSSVQTLEKPNREHCRRRESHRSEDRVQKLLPVNVFFLFPFPFSSFPVLCHPQTGCQRRRRYWKARENIVAGPARRVESKTSVRLNREKRKAPPSVRLLRNRTAPTAPAIDEEHQPLLVRSTERILLPHRPQPNPPPSLSVSRVERIDAPILRRCDAEQSGVDWVGEVDVA